jgi:hypothetical protein
MLLCCWEINGKRQTGCNLNLRRVRRRVPEFPNPTPFRPNPITLHLEKPYIYSDLEIERGGVGKYVGSGLGAFCLGLGSTQPILLRRGGEMTDRQDRRRRGEGEGQQARSNRCIEGG